MKAVQWVAGSSIALVVGLLVVYKMLIYSMEDHSPIMGTATYIIPQSLVGRIVVVAPLGGKQWPKGDHMIQLTDDVTILKDPFPQGRWRWAAKIGEESYDHVQAPIESDGDRYGVWSWGSIESSEAPGYSIATLYVGRASDALESFHNVGSSGFIRYVEAEVKKKKGATSKP